MTFRIESLVERFPAIDLEGMDNLASLDQRFDRKYVVSEAEASSLFAMVPGSLAALEIAGRLGISIQRIWNHFALRPTAGGSVGRCGPEPI